VTGARLESILRGRTRSDRLLRDVARVAAETDAEPYVVGGYVRDAALRQRARDLDLACARRTSHLVRGLQACWNTRGFRFRKRGVTTWRFTAEGRQVDLVDASRRGLPGDLLRRELTLNAIAYDVSRGRLRDPLRGLADLRAGRLNLPRPGVIREDPLRAVRAARFAARFPTFRLARSLLEEAAAVAPGLRRVSAERLREELNKLLEAPAPQRGLDLIEQLGLLPAVLPELVPLRACTAGRGRPDVWTHTLEALGMTSGRRRLPGAPLPACPETRRVLRWALLLHDISKPETLVIDSAGKPSFHGHEVLGARRADSVLRRLLLPRAERRRISRLVEHHLRPSHLADSGAPPRGMRRLVREAGEDLPLLVLHAACDARATKGPNAVARWRRLRAVLLELLALHRRRRRRPLPRLVDGDDVMRILNIRGGPEVGRVLERIRERQESGRLTDRDQALAYLARLRRSTP
jgi:tRNA nucleotidyltransferase/poly(A) polymerase